MTKALCSSDSDEPLAAAREGLITLLDTFVQGCISRPTEVERIIQLITNSPRAAYRDNFNPGHLTGSAWVVDPAAAKVLLLHHAKLDRWLQPGGHADGDYDLARVALREAQEESGLTSLSLLDSEVFDVDIHTIPERGDEPAHEHFDVRFVVTADSNEQPVISHESRGAAWVPLDAIHTRTSDESVLRMARTFRSRKR